jgi:putative sterol carrier protein
MFMTTSLALLPGKAISQLSRFRHREKDQIVVDSISDAVAAIARKVPSFSAGTAKFVVPGVGSIVIDANGPRESDDAADVTLTASADVFRGILDGRINPATAFMSGKLSVDGPLSMAMKLGSELR